MRAHRSFYKLFTCPSALKVCTHRTKTLVSVINRDKCPYADNVLEQRGEPWEVVQVVVFLFKPQSQVCSSASSF